MKMLKKETWKEQTPKSENVQKQSPTGPKDQHEQFTMVYLGSDPNLEARFLGAVRHKLPRKRFDREILPRWPITRGLYMVKCVIHANVRFGVREKHHLDTLGLGNSNHPAVITQRFVWDFQPAIGDAAILKLWWFQAPGHVFRVLNKVGRMVVGLSTSSWYTDQRSLLPRKLKIDTLTSSEFRNFRGFRYFFERINL